ncbi:hypothetical protein [Bradyrhizobium ottawaense]|uniref:Uncharacterized protein n=1 Tax=Bradyrhizobium ottawaense TaxID=931866 RepID=A0ABY0QHI5_9BRAD|nr:hypothetical protein [Bradyrhizobium ottawaense]SDK45125.1 hypothetical protein SAMN05444163_8142 [Bradyrhizobium ottawaense]
MTTSTAQPVPKEPPPPPINAKFADRLPLIMNEICDQLLVIEPAITRLSVQLREFLDFLDFEIKKADLEIKRMKWEEKVDLTTVRQAEAWLQKLRQLKTDFNVDVMTSPPETIRAMVDRIQKTFGI